MAEPLDVSHATRGEHAAILALHREAGWPGERVDGEVWAAREAGAVLGSVQLIPLAPAVILIDAIVVRADARGRWIGEQMLRVATVPALGTARVGTNPARAQHFLGLLSP